MISVKEISKRYGTCSAVKEVSISVNKGEVLAILGPSGCGKTTLLRLIAGLEKPDSGTIELENHLVSSPNRIIIPPSKRRLSMIFQDLALWPHMTVFENISFTLADKALSKTQIKDLVTQVLRQVHLDGNWERYPHQLSGGEKQRLALARAICTKPLYLLMDEPFGSLDVLLKREMMDLTLMLKRDYQIAIVYVTHDFEEACYVADRLAIMNQGEVIWSGLRKEVANWTKLDLINLFKK